MSCVLSLVFPFRSTIRQRHTNVIVTACLAFDHVLPKLFSTSALCENYRFSIPRKRHS